MHTNLTYLRLMADDDADMVITMIDMLLEELPTEFDKMVALYESANWGELAKVCHKMKSTLSFVGNEEMTKANREVELAAKHEQKLDQIPGHLTVMSRLLPAVLEELEAAKRE